MTFAIMLALWRNTGPLPLTLGGGAIGVVFKEGMLGHVRDLVR